VNRIKADAALLSAPDQGEDVKKQNEKGFERKEKYCAVSRSDFFGRFARRTTTEEYSG